MVKDQKDSDTYSLKNEKGETSVFERKTADYKDFGSRFSQSKKDFSKQFFHVYVCRLEEQKKAILPRAAKKWNNVKVLTLAELENFENERCMIIGTLFKHQLWKPSILRELSEETQEGSNRPEKHENYCSEKDTAFLEDGMLRIKIVGDKVDLSEAITGVVCALLGKKLEDGTFDVEDWCFPGCPPKKDEKLPPSDGKLLLVSGLDLATNSNSLAIQLLVEWVTGMAGTSTAQEEASSVVNLLIAGNSIKCSTPDHHNIQGLMSSKALATQDTQEISSAIQKLDELLQEMLDQCSIVLMPGEHDPTNLMFPQKPIHRFLLRESHKYDNFKGAGNPWVGTIGNRLIAGTSGQPIEDIMRVCGETKVTPIEWMEKTLEWRHYCPTAPDTLPSYPYNDKDLFIMQQCPDIYFVGNADKFETKLWKGEDGQTVRIICIPKFSTTSTAVLVDLKSLQTSSVYFGTS